jgi:hypothetical protein
MQAEDPNDPMPNNMNIWTTLSGYVLAAVIVFIMFQWSLTAMQLN